MTYWGADDPFGGRQPATPPTAYGAPAGGYHGSPTVPGGNHGQQPSAGPTNTLATLSVVFAFVVPPVGAVLGHLALNQINKRPQRGHQLALIGTVVSYVMTALLVVALVVWLTVGGGSAEPPKPPSTTTAAPTSTITTTPPPTSAPVTTTAPAGAVIDRAAVEPWLGDWTGVVSQPGGRIKTYTLNMHLEHDGRTVVGTVFYPDFPCGGRFEDLTFTGDVLAGREHITDKAARGCIDATVTLTLRPGEIAYAFPEVGGGSAVLRRPGPG